MPFTYTTDIPASGNNPSNDQPNMKVNTNSINSIIAVDHAGFADTNAGMHYLARFLNQTGLPAGLISGAAALYCNADSNSPNESEVFMSPGTTANVYQLTRTDTANYATFGTDAAYGAPPAGATQVGGWTFVPGGMLLQYGLFTWTVSGNNQVKFPKSFTTNVYSLTAQARSASASPPSYGVFNQDKTGFSVGGNLASGTAYWIAIGV